MSIPALSGVPFRATASAALRLIAGAAALALAVTTDHAALGAMAALAAVVAGATAMRSTNRWVVAAGTAAVGAAALVAIPGHPFTLPIDAANTPDPEALGLHLAVFAVIGTATLSLALRRDVPPLVASAAALAVPAAVDGLSGPDRTWMAVIFAAVAAGLFGLAAPHGHDRFGFIRLLAPGVAAAAAAAAGLAVSGRWGLGDVIAVAPSAGVIAAAAVVVAATRLSRPDSTPTVDDDVQSTPEPTSDPLPFPQARKRVGELADAVRTGSVSVLDARVELSRIVAADHRQRRWVIDPDSGRWRRLLDDHTIRAEPAWWRTVVVSTLVGILAVLYFLGGTNLTSLAADPEPPAAVPSAGAAAMIQAAEEAGPYSGNVIVDTAAWRLGYDFQVHERGADVWFRWDPDRSTIIPLDAEFLPGADPVTIRSTPWGDWARGGPYSVDTWVRTDLAAAGAFPLDGTSWWRDLIVSGPYVAGMGEGFTLLGQDVIDGLDVYRFDLGEIDMHAVAVSPEFPDVVRSVARHLWRSYNDVTFYGTVWGSTDTGGVPVRAEIRSGSNASITWDFEPPGEFPALPEPGTVEDGRSTPSLFSP